MSYVAVIAACLLAHSAFAELERENITTIFQMVSLECEACTAAEEDFAVYCEQGDGGSFVSGENKTEIVQPGVGNSSTIVVRSFWAYQDLSGQPFCWHGTFGQIKTPTMANETNYGSDNVTAKVACPNSKLFYNQCILDTGTTIVLIAVGSTFMFLVVVVLFFVFGLCRCCNQPGDNSNLGMCTTIGLATGCIPEDEEERLRREDPEKYREMEKQKNAAGGLFASAPAPSPADGGLEMKGTENPMHGK